MVTAKQYQQQKRVKFTKVWAILKANLVDPQTFSMNTTKTLKENLKGLNMLQHVNNASNKTLKPHTPRKINIHNSGN